MTGQNSFIPHFNGKDVESGVPDIEESMKTLIELSRQVGKQRVAWRYDPVLLTKHCYNVALNWHTIFVSGIGQLCCPILIYGFIFP